MARRKILVGDTVTVKTDWMKGNWGIVKMVDDGWYHVAMFGGDECMVFARDEIKLEVRT